MSGKIFADVVAGVPFPGGTRYVKVGVLLEMDYNDQSKGPGFVVMLDRYFNPAGIPPKVPGESSVALSTYWPKDGTTTGRTSSATPATSNRPKSRGAADPDDDIPS